MPNIGAQYIELWVVSQVFKGLFTGRGKSSNLKYMVRKSAKKGFKFFGWGKTRSEKKLQKVVEDILYHRRVYYLTFDKDAKEVDSQKRFIRTNYQIELTFEEAMEWLKKI